MSLGILLSVAAVTSASALDVTRGYFHFEMPSTLSTADLVGADDAQVSTITSRDGARLMTVYAGMHPGFERDVPKGSRMTMSTSGDGVIVKNVAWERDGRLNRDVLFDPGRTCPRGAFTEFEYRSLSSDAARTADLIIATVRRQGVCLPKDR